MQLMLILRLSINCLLRNIIQIVIMNLLSKKKKPKRNSSKFKKPLKFYRIQKREKITTWEVEKSHQWMDLIIRTLEEIFLKGLTLTWEIFLVKVEEELDLQWEENQIFLLKSLHKWPHKELEDIKDSKDHNKEEDNKITIYYFIICLVLEKY